MRNNYISSAYLSKCDLLHKLVINNINNCPEIDKISIQFSLKNIKENASSSTEMNTQIKGILVLYTLLGLNSLIEYHSEKNVIENYTKKSAHSYYTQKITLNKSADIENFLRFLFIENDFKNRAQFTSFKKLKTGCSSVSCNITLPLSAFSDLNEFCSLSVKDFSSKDLSIQLSFFIKNFKESDDSNLLVLSPFWHFG